jgi:hypothetical protein
VLAGVHKDDQSRTASLKTAPAHLRLQNTLRSVSNPPHMPAAPSAPPACQDQAARRRQPLRAVNATGNPVRLSQRGCVCVRVCVRVCEYV